MSKLGFAALLLSAAAPAVAAESAAPRLCIDRRAIVTVKAIDARTVIFKLRGHRNYRNDLPVDCASWTKPGVGYVFSSPSPEICRGEVVQLRDFTVPFAYGGCQLGAFTPVPGR